MSSATTLSSSLTCFLLDLCCLEGKIYPGFKVNGNGSAFWGESSFPFWRRASGRRYRQETKKYGFHSGHSIPHTHTLSILCLSL
ncbi:uncharacterized protein BO87DRAFT_21144 [Aspergillus neoniger CBS 115656]|uniref:Secreted protein n=1 Tax=Aspergillus neoniger (strain CBS 115656) TaxID=1448310 RepID=A0A318Z645_ASPNB|nr:hypothetical protein BO87DRAFT_21144 [Aspergillus neoniger CBS 115656]PYH35658.1 hypothetical protein BO87DRAFT_21144 [Aspergillus neoniger CBS 115656]